MLRRFTFLAMAAASLFLARGPLSAAPPDIDDILLTIKVRQILHQDQELRPYNIGVIVVDRVAILFGPVSKIEHALRAEARLRDLFELRDVRNDLDVSATLPILPIERVSSPARVPGQELPSVTAPANLPRR
jgi:hypothetical protein